MQVTIPVVKSCSVLQIRPSWVDNNATHELPEPVTWNGVTVNPGDGVKIAFKEGEGLGIKFVSLHHMVGEHWTLLWVTLDGPEEKLPVVVHDRTNHKIGVAGMVRIPGA